MAPSAVELVDYISRSDAEFAWRQHASGSLRFTAHRWHGVNWEHDLTLADGEGDLALLIVTGGDPNELDLEEQNLLARRTGMPVATLFHIPNQPIEDRWEDDLVAHTFERYVRTGEASWPLLFPMVKSAIRAMDVLEDATRGRIRRFLITGLSKRGWTAWLAAATGDPRIAGIAPMVIDNLSVAAQMHHQLETWGDYSPMIQDYTARGLPSMVNTSIGRELARLVDPFEYRDSISAPTLIVNGTNDPYWQVDALSLYWEHLSQPKWASIVPNAGHLLGDKVQQHGALCAFAKSLTGAFRMPTNDYKWVVEDGRVTATIEGLGEAVLWTARSTCYDFRESEWTRSATLVADLDPGADLACLAVSSHTCPVGEFRLTSPVRVFRSRR